MSHNSETYKIWIRLEFSHAYLPSGECGLTIEPDLATKTLLRKSGILLKKQTACSWLLVAPEKMLPETGDQLVFRLKPLNSDFYYYTDTAFVETEGCTLEDGEQGSWKTLRMILGEEQLVNGETVNVAMSSLSRHFEFIVFPPEKGLSNKLEVREENGSIKFSQPKELAFPGTEKYLWRFVTAEPLPLIRKSSYRFYLWEKRQSGDNQLARLPDVPLVKAFSPFSPEDTITSYFYL